MTAVPVKPEISSPAQIDDSQMNPLFGNMEWSNGYDDSVVITGLGGNPGLEQLWAGNRSPMSDLNSDFTTESNSLSPANMDARPVTASSTHTPPRERQHSVPPEALLFHAGLYGGYMTQAPALENQPNLEMDDAKNDGGMRMDEMEGDDESMPRATRPGLGGKGKRKSSSTDWENGISQDQMAHQRLQAASLENQYQHPQQIPIDTPGSRKKNMNLAKHLADQPLIPLSLPFSDPALSIRQLPSMRLLFINCDFPIKSRVETQTTLRIIVQGLPEGVKKLHMPRQTISRPKQMLKEPHVPSPDTMELDCYVVCETAWRKCPETLIRDAYRKACRDPELENPHNKLRRFEEDEDEKPSTRERGPSVVEMSLSDPKNPLNGGEVWVCAGCMDREGKRSTRKKVKRPKEEQPWWDLESRRIVLMNTMEIRDWCMVPKDQYVPFDNADSHGQPQYHVDSPVRIACYCRHQHEKIGYRYVFDLLFQ